MIKYRLACKEGHEFEGWFQSSLTYDAQAERGQVACPHCGTVAVSKAIMAPSLATRGDVAPAGPASDAAQGTEMRRLMHELRQAVETNAEYVGPRFAEEARKIHFEESPPRGIYGKASLDDVKALCDDGIPVLPLPRGRENLN